MLSLRDFYFALLQDKESWIQLLDTYHAITLEHIKPLQKYASLESMAWRVGEQPNINEPLLFDLWNLYAFSRINHLLLLRFQPDSPNIGEWSGPELTLNEYRQFMGAMGFTRIECTTFHPFFHEIVTVEQSSNDDEPITLCETVWPGYTMGTMLISRAGVRVRGGTNHIVKEVAENSTLYWTFRRRNRLVDDLSHGWGSNSQWRTEFRRDYQTDTAFYYNVDKMPEEGKSMLSSLHQDELTADERIELLRNRCFVKTTKPHQDIFPYNDFYVEEKR